MIRRVEPTEHQIQCAIVEWANKVPLLMNWTIGDFLIAIPNGGKRTQIKNKNGKYFSLEGLRLKKEGVKAGVSDLFLTYSFVRPSEYNDFPVETYGLWIEIKKKGGKMSKAQVEWFKRMEFIGHDVVMIETVDEGIQAIKDYLGDEINDIDNSFFTV